VVQRGTRGLYRIIWVVVVMPRKLYFLYEKGRGDYVMTSKVVLILGVHHIQSFPHSMEDLNTVKETLASYLSRVLNTHGNPRTEIDTLIWGELNVRKKTS